MKKIIYYNYYLLVLFLVTFLPLSAQFKIEGIVKHNNKAIAAALISLNNESGKLKDVQSNASGNFSLNLKPNEEYTVFITKPGFTKSEIVVSTLGFSEEDAAKTKGITQLEVDIFELPFDETAILKINEIFSSPILSYYYDFDKNALVSDESLEESLKGELAKVQKIVDEERKKANPAAELELQYKKEIAEADKLFKAKTYDLASLSYNQALALKPSETYPKLRLEEIEKLTLDAGEKERMAKEKEKANALEKERLAKEKELAIASAKDKLAKEKAMADAAEAERIAKQKLIADAAEQERLSKEKANSDAADKLRIAKELNLANAAELTRLAKEKEDALALEKTRIAKEKATADAAEADRIAKEKAFVDAAEKERLDKEKSIADANEKERLAKEEEARNFKKKYTLAINTADSALLAKNYTAAKAAYNVALAMKPTEAYPKARIEEIDLAISKSGEFKNELAKKYPEGITEEIVKEGNATVTRRIVVIGNKGVLYIMRRTSFGAVFYFKDDAAITENEFRKNTEVK